MQLRKTHPPSENPPTSTPDTHSAVLVVDVANLMGSRPNGWWRDRAGAATTILAQLSSLAGSTVFFAPVGFVTLVRIIAVIEGAAKAAKPSEGVEIIKAPQDGDSSIVEMTENVMHTITEDPTPTTAEKPTHGAPGEPAHEPPGHPVPLCCLVVTADRGLRKRLPPGTFTAGPSWLNALLDPYLTDAPSDDASASSLSQSRKRPPPR
ncbi:hypothetical protein [Lysinibacter sp. HNR]|uniref:hypothetical protein n=1 Tax=Lysinibacter sp. HNR TaxID=3031408 RepID=UPI00243557CC|nr:hypothetical protein [Lysinibacter sp. HNR]WGD37496.1 hypothetical protein FrondiHNR_00810 [Lysinibacter sp. HNR]